MNTKIVYLKGGRRKAFIQIIASQFGVHSPGELKIIDTFCQFEMFQSFYLDKHTRAKLIKHTELPMATFSTCLRRLVKANIIARQGKTMCFNSSFKGLDNLDRIVFQYSEIPL